MTYRETWRDKLAYWIASEAFRIATPEYRAFVYMVSVRGLDVLAAELAEQEKSAEQ